MGDGGNRGPAGEEIDHLHLAIGHFRVAGHNGALGAERLELGAQGAANGISRLVFAKPLVYGRQEGGQWGVASQYHRNVFRSVPGAVVIRKFSALGLGDNFLIADGQAVREARAGKEIRPHLVAEALGGVFSAPGFLQDYPAFLVQFLGQQRHAEGIVTEHHQGLVHLFRFGVGCV